MALPGTERKFSVRFTNSWHKCEPHSLPPAQTKATCTEVKQRCAEKGVRREGHTSGETGGEHKHLRIPSESGFCCCDDSMTKTT